MGYNLPIWTLFGLPIYAFSLGYSLPLPNEKKALHLHQFLQCIKSPQSIQGLIYMYNYKMAFLHMKISVCFDCAFRSFNFFNMFVKQSCKYFSSVIMSLQSTQRRLYVSVIGTEITVSLVRTYNCPMQDIIKLCISSFKCLIEYTNNVSSCGSSGSKLCGINISGLSAPPRREKPAPPHYGSCIWNSGHIKRDLQASGNQFIWTGNWKISQQTWMTMMKAVHKSKVVFIPRGRWHAEPDSWCFSCYIQNIC